MSSCRTASAAAPRGRESALSAFLSRCFGSLSLLAGDSFMRPPASPSANPPPWGWIGTWSSIKLVVQLSMAAFRRCPVRRDLLGPIDWYSRPDRREQRRSPSFLETAKDVLALLQRHRQRQNRVAPGGFWWNWRNSEEKLATIQPSPWGRIVEE